MMTAMPEARNVREGRPTHDVRRVDDDAEHIDTEVSIEQTDGRLVPEHAPFVWRALRGA